MNALDLQIVLLVAGALVVLAGWLAAYRPGSREIGIAAGLSILAAGLAANVLGVSEPGGLLFDAVSQPRIPVVGAGLVAVFAVMPTRHATPTTSVALVALALSNIGLVLVPSGTAAGVIWVACSTLTWLALGSSPARRLAMPYLALSAGAGLVGSTLGGTSGSALLLLAVAIRLGVFPFHSWAVAAFHLAPTSRAVAVLAPMSAIALVAREPLGFEGSLGTATSFGLAGAALLTAAMPMVQRDLSRAVGFLTVSVSTVVLLGVLDTDHIGHLGGLIMWNLTGLSLLGTGLVTAALTSRTGTLPVDVHSGLAGRAPVFATLFLLFGLASVGAPGTADFASEDLVLHGAMAHHPLLLVLFITAVSVQGYAVLHLFYRVFFGPVAHFPLADALTRERVALFAMAALLVVSGLAPQLLVDEWATPSTAEVVTVLMEAP